MRQDASPLWLRIRERLTRDNRIYIMPSGRGVVFLMTVVVLVLTASTYNNNLIFLLSFFLFALFVVSMVQTHYNLKGVRLHFHSADDGFAGEPFAMLFELEQKRARFKWGLRVRALRKSWEVAHAEATSMLPSESRKPVRVSFTAPARGVHRLPGFVLESYFPLGLFRAWKVFRPQGEVLICPRPRGERVLQPVNFEYGEHDLGLRHSPEGDFGELKEYQPGESYRQIAWKHFARTGKLYTKIHWGEEHKHFRLPFDPSSGRTEEHLEQMSEWIRQALHEGATFEMELPRFQLPAGGGPEHAREGWRALARFREAA